MLIDLMLDPFDAQWPDMRAAAFAAERAGFDGLWCWDHLAGRVHRQNHVLECWTVLSALAAVTERVTLGPLVLNVANRSPGTLAVAAATLQHISGGRLILGLGAGGGARTPYASEQVALGRTVTNDPHRRTQVRATIAELRTTWTGRAYGFLRPEPTPPIIVGAFGRKMAALAGELADGLNTAAANPDLPGMVEIAREEAGDRPFTVTVFAGFSTAWLDPKRPEVQRLIGLGVDRLVLLVQPPYHPEDLERAGKFLPRIHD